MAYNIYDRNKLRNKSAVYNAELVEPRVNADNIVFNTDNVPPSPQPQPVVDTRNSIVSLATLLGPTPEEREAQQRKLQGHKSKMAAWTGLFDGLRNLGNLYAVSKGATPQQYSNPYKAVDQQATEAQQWLDDIQRNRQSYAMMLHNLQRQDDQDEMRRQAHEAQMKYYKERDDNNARKMDLAEFKAKTDADYKQATLAQKNAINEVRIRLMEGQINKTEADRQYRLIMAGNASFGTTTTVTKPDGSVTTTVKKPARGKAGGAPKAKGKTISGYVKSNNQGSKGKAY